MHVPIKTVAIMGSTFPAAVPCLSMPYHTTVVGQKAQGKGDGVPRRAGGINRPPYILLRVRRRRCHVHVSWLALAPMQGDFAAPEIVFYAWSWLPVLYLSRLSISSALATSAHTHLGRSAPASSRPSPHPSPCAPSRNLCSPIRLDLK